MILEIPIKIGLGRNLALDESSSGENPIEDGSRKNMLVSGAERISNPKDSKELAK